MDIVLKGWYIGSTKCGSEVKIDAPTTITAKYSIKEYTVTTVYNNGMSNTIDEVSYGSYYSLPSAPTKEGYNFDGWYVEDSKCEYSIRITGDTIIEARYSIMKLDVTIVYDNGTPNTVEEVSWGSSFAIPEPPQKDGCEFLGWYVGGIKSDSILIIKSNTTLYAKYSEAYYMKLKTDNTYEITGLKDYDRTELELPSRYNGLPVTSIGNWAFDSYSKITKVIIPDSVVSIGNYAFEDCSSLTSISIPDSVLSIGSYAFHNCTSLNNVKLPDGLTILNDVLFYGCTELSSIQIPNSITAIGVNAFAECTSLTSFTIPDGVKTIGDCAFRECSSLSSIAIPASVTDIFCTSFIGCENLELIEVDSNNKYFSSESGVLYNKNKTEIISYHTASGSVIIPDGIESIGPYSFGGCTRLASVVIPDSVKTIGNNAFISCTSLSDVSIGKGVTTIEKDAFYCCTNLESITIPESVTSIGETAFYRCEILNNFNYDGTIVQWKKMSRSYNWKKDSPFTVVHCSDGDSNYL